MVIIRNYKFPGKRMETPSTRFKEYDEETPIHEQVMLFMTRTKMTQAAFLRKIKIGADFMVRAEEGRLREKTIQRVRQFMKHYR